MSVATRAAATKDPKKRVVITGMGVASVFGNDVDTFYDALLAGTSGIATITRFDASEFPTNFGGQIKVRPPRGGAAMCGTAAAAAARRPPGARASLRSPGAPMPSPSPHPTPPCPINTPNTPRRTSTTRA